MKLLLDENLSRRIILALQNIYPGSSQVALLNLNETNDADIWEYAKQEGYAIVTQDADFHEYSLLTDGPPLVIWLRCGNQPKTLFWINCLLTSLISNKLIRTKISGVLIFIR